MKSKFFWAPNVIMMEEQVNDWLSEGERDIIEKQIIITPDSRSIIIVFFFQEAAA